jgi:hypothetical protein
MASRPDRFILKLTRDLEEFKRSTDRGLASHDKRMKRVEDSLDKVLTSLKHIQITQTALTNALTSTLSEIALSRKLEGRVERLESAVFRKH